MPPRNFFGGFLMPQKINQYHKGETVKIQEIKDDLSELGLSENLSLATLIYLAALMSKTAYKISILVNGPAGMGKSHVARSVLKLFPEEDIITSSRITPAGLMQCGDLSKKIMFVYEKFYDPQFAQYIRELISEGEVVYMKDDGVQKLKGPITLIETTVNVDTVGTENRSRCFVVGINASDNAKSNILDKIKQARTADGLSMQNNIHVIAEKHKEFQKGLDSSLHVVIPFATEIKFNASPYHTPRILQRVLNVISAVAFIDQTGREQKSREGVTYIEATRDDFEQARQILTGLRIDEEEFLLSGDAVEFVKFLQSNKESLFQKPKFNRNDVIDLQVGNVRRWSYKVVAKYLCLLVRAGFLDEKPLRGTKNSVEYQFSKDFTRTILSQDFIGCYSSLSLP
jgi:hypothetical protein